MARMVMVTNMVNGMVSVKDPSTGVNRRWMKRGQTQPIPYEALEQLLWQDGFRNMLETGVLYIKDMKDKKDLGLEPEEATKPTNILALSEVEMKNLLEKTPFDVFKKEVLPLPRVQVDNLIEFAIENKIVDTAKCAFLKQVSGKDILLAISRKEEDEEIEKKEKARMAASGHSF